MAYDKWKMQTAPKCQIYPGEPAIWAWQPFGPSEDIVGSFTCLGSHYRGFPVIKISDYAKKEIERVGTTYADILFCFSYKGDQYQLSKTGIKKL